MRLLVFVIVVATSLLPAFAQSSKGLFFKGEMTQKSPLKWEGPFVLYLEFDEEKDAPQPIGGFIQWPTLGDAKTKLSGTRLSDSKFEFSETECVAGDCTKVVLGGKYSASGSAPFERMKGTAEGMFGLSGTFRLEKIRPEDWR